jgi:DNA polymerase I-like protein with 3'-5' exonuclease and polymerase domains
MLSGDDEMAADYRAGDPYLAFAKKIGLVPQDATKATHRTEREIVKSLILGTQYGMGEKSLALKIGKSSTHARELLDAHRNTYRKFWAWSDAAVNYALFHGYLWTRFGWRTHVKYHKSKDDDHDDPNIRSLQNYPCQGNAADMLRLAAGFIVDSGVQLDATIHDAVLIEADSDKIDAAVESTRRAMNRASQLALHGFVLRTDVEVIRHPERYRDDRECAFFDELMGRLQARLQPGKSVKTTRFEKR